MLISNLLFEDSIIWLIISLAFVVIIVLMLLSRNLNIGEIIGVMVL
ncbi:MAG: hypothetical protein ACFE7S_08060 [Candidatus Hodarchaeota archaeon]